MVDAETLDAQRNTPLGTEENLSYDMAGGKGKFLQRNLLAPYEIILKKTHCPVTPPTRDVSAPYS